MPFSEQEINSIQVEFGLTYHVTMAKQCEELVGFGGKDVLEVGGSLPAGFVFDYLQAKSWTALETAEYGESLQQASGITHKGTQLYSEKTRCEAYQLDDETVDPDERYRFFLGNIEELPERFYNRFDLVFSIACFEHLQHLPEALAEMYKALRVGGKLFAMFAPVWSAHNGHHLPQITDRSGTTYNHEKSPIPPWGHLTLRPPQMFNYLLEHTDREAAGKMVYYTYHSPFINRLFTEDYMGYFQMSDFTIERFEASYIVQISPEAQKKLEKLYPQNKLFDNSGILLIGSRPK